MTAFLLVPLNAEPKLDFPVHEGLFNYWVRATSQIPSEVSNETQARALAREAAVVMGQDSLMNYVLQKKARSKRTLKVAIEPSLELQGKLNGFIKGARVTKTRWTLKDCTVTLELPKSEIRSILKKN